MVSHNVQRSMIFVAQPLSGVHEMNSSAILAMEGVSIAQLLCGIPSRSQTRKKLAAVILVSGLVRAFWLINPRTMTNGLWESSISLGADDHLFNIQCIQGGVLLESSYGIIMLLEDFGISYEYDEVGAFWSSARLSVATRQRPRRRMRFRFERLHIR